MIFLQQLLCGYRFPALIHVWIASAGVLELFISTSGEATSACKPFWHNGWGNSGMNECRKSIPTQELLQENHSLMFWQFGKFHISTSAQKLSSYIFCRENLSNQCRIVNWHQIVWIHTTNAYFIIKNLSKWHVTLQEKHTSTSAQKLSSYYLIPWWFDEFFYHNSWNFAAKI